MRQVFDEYALLQIAEHAFWTDGYEATSVEGVAETVGVPDANVYATYGSKIGLFQAVLEIYCDATVEGIRISANSNPASLRECIETLFAAIIANSASQPHRRGCLMLNGLVELGAREPGVLAICRQATADMEAIVEARLCLGVLDGQLAASERECAAMAAHIIVVAQGLIQMSRLKTDQRKLVAAAAISTSMLPWTPSEELPAEDVFSATERIDTTMQRYRSLATQLPSFPIDVVTTEKDPFRNATCSPFGDFTIRHVSSVSAEIHAHSSDLPDEELVEVQIQHVGALELRQGGSTTIIEPGDLVIFDASHPFVLKYPEWYVASTFQVPKRLLGLSDGDLAALRVSPVSSKTGIGSVAAATITQMARTSADLGITSGVALSHSIVDIVRILAANRLHTDPPQSAIRRALLNDVTAYIDRHLHEPTLSPRTIADAHHLSVRSLHLLFEEEDETVSKLIQRLRLERALVDLETGTTSSISGISERWGFSSASHFTRVFKQNFGISPSTAQRTGRLV